jgi:hypothetical protein
MIYPGRVMLNEELLVYGLDGENGAPEKVHSRAHLRQDSEIGIQPLTGHPLALRKLRTPPHRDRFDRLLEPAKLKGRAL